MFGALPDKALGFYGPLKYQHKQLSGELRIMTWAHFVPAYDTWLDGTYAKQWGEANDVEVKFDHINNALLVASGSSEIAAQSGHDLHWFISPPSAFQKQVVPVNDLVQEVTKKFGPMAKVAKKSTYNPKTKKFFGFPETYAPDPVQYRRSYLQEAGVSLNTWEDLRKGAAKLKANGHPVGLGMSNEIDSNMLLTSLLYCYGGFIQNEENRIVLNQGANRKGAIEALQVMRDIYTNGMTDEVFAWTAASNNNAFVAGRLSVALNAISIVRTAEKSGNAALADDTWLASIPRGPVMRLGNEHVMGVYVIWKFSKNKEAAQEVPHRPATQLPAALRSQRVLQLPAVDGIDQGRVRDNPQDRCDGHAQAEGEVHRPDDDRREVHDEPRPPGPLERGDRRDLHHVHDPADVRPGRAGKGQPGRCGQGVRHQGEADLSEVEGPGARIEPTPLRNFIRGPRAPGPSAFSKGEKSAQRLDRLEQKPRRHADDRPPSEGCRKARQRASLLRVVDRPLEPVLDCALRIVAGQPVLACKGVQRRFVPNGQDELLARDVELARRAVERGQHDLLEHRLEIAGVAPVPRLAGIGGRSGLVRCAAEREIGNDDRRHRRDRHEEGKRPAHVGVSRTSTAGRSALRASAAARRKGPENALVTAR